MHVNPTHKILKLHYMSCGNVLLPRSEVVSEFENIQPKTHSLHKLNPHAILLQLQLTIPHD